MTIEVALDGRVGGTPTIRIGPTGKQWLSLSLAVNTGDDKPEWVSVALFGEPVEGLPDDLAKGARVYVDGKLRMNRWVDKAGGARASLQVAATRALLLDRIGRRRRKAPRPGKAAAAAANDETGENEAAA
jgi:single-strand DNA-binding protein